MMSKGWEGTERPGRAKRLGGGVDLVSRETSGRFSVFGGFPRCRSSACLAIRYSLRFRNELWRLRFLDTREKQSKAAEGTCRSSWLCVSPAQRIVSAGPGLCCARERAELMCNWIGVSVVRWQGCTEFLRKQRKRACRSKRAVCGVASITPAE